MVQCRPSPPTCFPSPCRCPPGEGQGEKEPQRHAAIPLAFVGRPRVPPLQVVQARGRVPPNGARTLVHREVHPVGVQNAFADSELQSAPLPTGAVPFHACQPNGKCQDRHRRADPLHRVPDLRVGLHAGALPHSGQTAPATRPVRLYPHLEHEPARSRRRARVSSHQTRAVHPPQAATADHSGTS